MLFIDITGCSYRPALFSVLVMCCLLCLWSIAQADTIYKSVDKDGNVTYSVTPPEDAVRVEPVEIDAGEQAPEDTDERIKQMHEIADELREDRKQRELERKQAAEEARAEQEKAEQQRKLEEMFEQYADRYRYYYPYPYPPYRPPHRPHPPYKPRPPKPPLEVVPLRIPLKP